MQHAHLPRSLVMLLAMMTGLEALAIDIYLPAFGAMALTLNAAESQVALTLPAFLIGVAGGQIGWAPLLDLWGRRATALVGVGLFIAASALCALTPGLVSLLTGRLVQGVAAAVVIMVPRVIVADRADERSQAAIHSTLMQMFLIVPVAAPLVGGVLLPVIGWRGLFGLLMLVGCGVLFWAWHTLPETRDLTRRTTAGAGILLGYRMLLKDQRFCILITVNAMMAGALFGYLGNIGPALSGDLGFTPQQVSLLLAMNAGGLILSAGLNRKLLHRLHPSRILMGGLVTVALAGLGMSALLTIAPDMPAAWSLACLFLAISGVSLTFPNLTAMTMTAAGEHRSTGAGMAGLAQNLGGALIATLTFRFGGHMPGLGLALALPVMTGIGLLVIAQTRRQAQRVR